MVLQSGSPHGPRGGASAPDPAADREAILAHIRSVFEAYVRGDAERIRATHTTDWRGFQIKSDRLVRGIDEHMKNALATLEAVETLAFELLEAEVELYGDMAVVYYVARDVIRPRGGEETVLYLRALDVYRRTPEGWNQCGSNICLMPEVPSWIAGAR